MEFYIDLGGTFCDVFCKTPSGKKIIMKLLSEDPNNYEDAPREAIRRILSEETGKEIAKTDLIDASLIKCIRMGTTVATNALLERKGEPIALLITKGFRDLLFIGNQARPNIFDLKIESPEVIYKEVVEIDERIVLCKDDCELDLETNKQNIKYGITGEKVVIHTPLNENQLIHSLRRIKDQKINSIAIALMHSYTYPEHEQRIKHIAVKLGFKHITLSSEIMPMIKLVQRGYTTCVDAYLTPHIHRYIHGFASGFKLGLNKLNVLFMQSDGGLAPANSFTGCKAILSGPSSGVVGFTETCATEFGRGRKVSNESTNSVSSINEKTNCAVIGFDMGGTSTDVYRYNGRELEHSYESMTSGVPIQCPQLDITTVASGGGSLLRLVNGLFMVGPESAGANPGPVCYRNGGTDLTVTDANLCLGRVLPDYFPAIFGKNHNEKLDKETVCRVFEELALEINSNNLYYRRKDNGRLITKEEVALGFIRVANESMCRPIRNITQGKGYDTSSHLLCSFGGASGQMACSVARNLGIKRVFIHKYASILSAYGMGLANVVNEQQEPSSILFKEENYDKIDERIDYLKSQSRKKLIDQGFTDDKIDYELYLNLRYTGTDFAIMTKPYVTNKSAPYCLQCNFEKAFVDRYRREFGFTLNEQEVLVDDIRVRGIGKSHFVEDDEFENDLDLQVNSHVPHPDSLTDVYFEDIGYQKTAVFKTTQLRPGNMIDGPCIVIDENSTILVEPGCTLEITKRGNFLIKILQDVKQTVSTELDPIQLSIFSHRFMSIAEQMGRVLQRTSISTNIKERLDFSCALFDQDGDLTSSAPHIPVHLGSMQEAVKSEINYFGDDLKPGDVLLTNHPSSGGTHLPDLTTITPVFYRNLSAPVFYVASRGHHSDVGGLTPGSMPPNSTSLIEEGATFRCFKLVEQGVFQEQKVIDAFMAPGKIEGLSGCRTLKDNLSDLKAQIAANQKGLMLVNELIDYYGLDVVQAYMRYIQENASKSVKETFQNIVQNADQQIKNSNVNRNSLYKSNDENSDKHLVLTAEDYMDDGTTIRLQVTIDKEDYSAKFDFSGSGLQVLGNCNAPKAITYSAIIYALRCMIRHEIPLNQGCLKNIKIEIPNNCILNPSSEAAVVGGNVLTSQRVVDVIFKAFETCAASQGCMNNITFGDENSSYYETLGGGAGAGPSWHGRSGVHTHMTNTRITDPEILEKRYPVILKKFLVNRNTGGKGKYNGGDGLIRELLFRKELVLSVLTERRVFAPYGLQGGEPAKKGKNILYKKDNRPINLGSKATYKVKPGDLFHIETPGGGGYGSDELIFFKLNDTNVLIGSN